MTDTDGDYSSSRIAIVRTPEPRRSPSVALRSSGIRGTRDRLVADAITSRSTAKRRKES